MGTEEQTDVPWPCMREKVVPWRHVCVANRHGPVESEGGVSVCQGSNRKPLHREKRVIILIPVDEGRVGPTSFPEGFINLLFF